MGTQIARAIIGNTDKRNGWIGQTDGSLPTFPGPIPVAEVERLLFNWEAISVPTGNFIPCSKKDADIFIPIGTDGVMTPVKIAVTQGAQGIVRSDDFTELGRHKASYRIHDYKTWLIRYISNVLQDTLRILSALTLKNGAQAAVEIGLDETMHDGKSGLDFWPFLLCTTSMDGSIATSYSAFNRILKCDNMFTALKAEARNANRQFKIKHTSQSMSVDTISGVRQALSILDQSATNMTDYVHELIAIKLTRTNWLDVLEIIEPPAPEGASKAKVTKTENRREAIDAVYSSDPMSMDWMGTAFGAVQAFNTYRHHYEPVRSVSRLERVYDKAIRGEFIDSDSLMLSAVGRVLDRPELISAQ